MIIPSSPALSPDAHTCTTRALTGEEALCAAVLHRAWADCHAPARYLREPAHAFFCDTVAVQWWDDLLQLDGALLRQTAHLRDAVEVA